MIISGVGRGAMDAALASDFPCGGWCPEGRQAEDASIPDRYAVIELPCADYLERTRQNVIDSDATLVIHFTELTASALHTLQLDQKTLRFLPVQVGHPYRTTPRAIRTPGVREMMRAPDLDIREMAPGEIVAMLKFEHDRWRPIVKASEFNAASQ